MIVNQGSVNMKAASSAQRSCSRRKQVLRTNIATGEKQYSEKSFSATYDSYSSEHTEGSLPSYSEQAGIYLPVTNTKERPETFELMGKLRLYLMNLRKTLFEGIGRGFGNTLDFSTSGTYSLWRYVEYEEYTYEEHDSMSFETTGQVITADGRTLEFNMQLEMSRDYVEKSESLKMGMEAIMTDPLVISLDSNPVDVSDVKWSFDIDGDGQKDSISMLKRGAGFLALDKNGNGRIDDGTELFGAKTGNGFAELMAYDEDGNGWIDEADSIYEKLSVWQKDDSGQDKLMTLKQAGVGAIYLGSAATEYALKSEETNAQNARIRRSGMYLTESGTAKTIQQLDMVKSLIS